MVEEDKKATGEQQYCTKGWNWGNYTTEEEQLGFQMGGMQCFGVPYSEIANANITNKNEVTVEFHQDDTDKDGYTR
jgi:structure-specific recognition protein 1